MRVLSKKRLREFSAKHPESDDALARWFKLAREASWKNFSEVKATFGAVDTSQVRSGNTVYVFDIKGNDFRLVAAIHFNTAVVYVLRVMTHREYDRDIWKDAL